MAKEKKIKWLTVAVLVPIVIAIITNFPNIISIFFNKSSLPEFKLKKVIYHPDSTMLVESNNDAAKKYKPLNFEIDNLLFFDAGKPSNKKNKIQWSIHLSELDIPQNIKQDGKHKIRFGFSNQNTSQFLFIVFDSKEPQANIFLKTNNNNEKRVAGTIFDDNLFEDQDISVEIGFINQENLQFTRIPVRRLKDGSGRTIYEFEYNIQNIPIIEPDDPKYNQLFFSLSVKDEAGNNFSTKYSYDAFIASGIHTFSDRTVEVTIKKKYDEFIQKETKLKHPKISPPKNKIHLGPPLIKLLVLIRSHNFIKLTWNRLPQKYRDDTNELYEINRNNQTIGLSFDSTFTDRKVIADSVYHYQIFAKGKNNIYYMSNKLPVSTLPIPEPENIVIPPIPLEEIRENLKDMPPIQNDIFNWVKENQIVLPNLIKRLMNYKTTEITSYVPFHLNGQLYDLFIINNEIDNSLKICLIEKNKYIIIIDEGFKRNPRFFKKGLVNRSDDGSIISFTSNMDSFSTDDKQKFYQIFLSWWRSIKAN